MSLETNTKINCPDCGESILINTLQLLQGVKFTCFNCHCQIGLANDSKSTVENALKKIGKLK